MNSNDSTNNNEIIMTEEVNQKIDELLHSGVKDKTEDELLHYGVKGQKWGKRRYQNPDGTLTPEGKIRYGYDDDDETYDEDGNSTDSDDAKKVREIRGKSSSQRSNKDIQTANERQRLQNENIRLQQEYDNLTKQPTQYERFKAMLKEGAEVTGNMSSILGNANKFIQSIKALGTVFKGGGKGDKGGKGGETEGGKGDKGDKGGTKAPKESKAPKGGTEGGGAEGGTKIETDGKTFVFNIVNDLSKKKKIKVKK